MQGAYADNDKLFLFQFVFNDSMLSQREFKRCQAKLCLLNLPGPVGNY